MTMIRVAALFIFFLVIASCQQSRNIISTKTNGSVNDLATNIRILASDEFQGRKPFTTGETKTINYLKEQFISIGIEPGGPNSYFQEVPMVSIATVAAPTIKVAGHNKEFELKGYEDYVVWTEKTDPVVSLVEDELVFAGFGIVAPEYHWNDYADIDVKGKVVMVMVNDPGFYGSKNLFKGDTMTYYGRWIYKFEEAARQGAKGCLIVHNTKAASYPFSVLQNSWNGSKLRLDDRKNPQQFCSVVGWVSETAATKLIEMSGQDTSLFGRARRQGFKAVPLPLKITTSIGTRASYDVSNNVIGKITGATKPDEFIIYSAHWDHLGIGRPDGNGDSIYNGAVDNASGAAGLLELARMFKQAKKKPQRSILFIAVTAEEQGLWGSAYYAENPIYPLAKTLANINLDGLNAYGKTRDIIVVGNPQTELETYLKKEAKRTKRYIIYNKSPQAGHYYRSDHFSFARVGVPALYAGSGSEVIGQPAGYGQKWKDEYGSKKYHRPGDEYDEKTWRLDGAYADLNVLYKLGQRVAAARKWPQWRTDSEFRLIRERSLKEQAAKENK
jgi:Zn-dependent M28 family amino/carboxypeptidase